MFPSYRVLSSQTTTIAECQWLFNCYLIFGGAESPTQATEDSIEITKRLGLVLMVKGRKLLLMYRQDLSILALLFCLHRFV